MSQAQQVNGGSTGSRWRRPEDWLLGALLVCAFGVRAWGLAAGVPFAVGIDEPVLVNRSLGILLSGDWNTRNFDYPTLVPYIQASVTQVCFELGAVWGRWVRMADIDIKIVYEAGRFVAALIGGATVWLTYRLGKDLDSRWLGLAAAAQLAVYPMHVRESHFILTDVPVTAFVTLTLLLALRAGRLRTVSAYAWAGCAAGLAAGAKYNGIVVVTAVAVVWLIHERTAHDGWMKALAAAAATVGAFLAAVPYALLDRPLFVRAFRDVMTHFSLEGRTLDEAPWRTYLNHLSLAGGFWLPMAALAVGILLWWRRRLDRWAAVVAFALAYFYVLATHAPVFGRYTLPLLPVLCLLTSVPLIALGRFVEVRVPGRGLGPTVTILGAAAMTAVFASQTVDWLADYQRANTRSIAGSWMVDTLPRGTKVVVEGPGPAYLERVGFEVVDHPDRIDGGRLEAYLKAGAEYVVLAPWTATDPPEHAPILGAGRIVFGVDPSAQRWGPFVRVVKLNRGYRE